MQAYKTNIAILEVITMRLVRVAINKDISTALKALDRIRSFTRLTDSETSILKFIINGIA